MRAFVGLPLPEPAVAALEAVQDGLQTGRHVPPENFHITLAFLGDQDAATLGALHEDLEGVPARALSLRFEGLDLFGSAERPKLIAATVAADAGLSALRDRVRRAARAAGVDLPRERFRPHVTLARFRNRPPQGTQARVQAFLMQAGGFGFGPFEATRFALYRSTLTPEGSVYEELASYPLR